MSAPPIAILHFSDVLCVWAYVAQIRVDELERTFGAQVAVDYHFCSVFGDAHRKIAARWAGRGGMAAYAAHVRTVAAGFEHAPLHAEVWGTSAPRSSLSVHLFLRAVGLAEREAELPAGSFARALWATRCAFFRDGRDVSTHTEQVAVATALALPLEPITLRVESGAAHADLAADFELQKQHTVDMSPTLLFNEGRQRLNGNVGYRVIEANVRELVERAAHGQSWC